MTIAPAHRREEGGTVATGAAQLADRRAKRDPWTRSSLLNPALKSGRNLAPAGVPVRRIRKRAGENERIKPISTRARGAGLSFV